MNRKTISALLICFVALWIIYCSVNAYATFSSVMGDPIDNPKPNGDPIINPKPNGDPIDDPIPDCNGDPIFDPKPHGDPIDNPKPHSS